MSLDPKQTKRASAKLGSFRQKRIARPYLRPEERPEAFDELAAAWRRKFPPFNSESEALLDLLAYIAWRTNRCKLDEILISACDDNPGQPGALKSLEYLREGLDLMGSWMLNAYLYFERIHNFDTLEAMDSIVENPELGSFLQIPSELPGTHIPAPLPPKTKPN
jgi:hypothetical protein